MMGRKRKTEINDDSELIEKKEKRTNKNYGHNLNGLTNYITHITNKPSKKEQSINKGKLVKKTYRLPPQKIKCSNCPFTGVESLFTTSLNKKYCPDCSSSQQTKLS